jgi:hypothetical protein
MQNEQIVKELSNLRMKHEARSREQAAQLNSLLVGLDWGPGPKATSQKRRQAGCTNQSIQIQSTSACAARKGKLMDELLGA